MSDDEIEKIREAVRLGGSSCVSHIVRSFSPDNRIESIVVLTKIAHECGLLFPGFKRYIEEAITSVNQLTETYSLASDVFGGRRAIPLCVKRGIASAFNKFGPDQIASHSDQSMSLRELVSIVHPSPSDPSLSEAIKKILSS